MAERSVPIPQPEFFTDKILEFVEELVHFTLEIAPPGKLLPKKAEGERRQEQLIGLLERQKVGDEMRSGIISIVDFIDKLDDPSEYVLVTQNIAKMGSVIQTKTEFSTDISTLQELLGLSDGCIKKVFKIATQLFEKKKYDEALPILRVLTVINPFVYAWWHALALTHLQMHSWEEALMPLAVATLLDPASPAPRIYACECYMALGDFESAEEELILAEEIVSEHQMQEWDEAVVTLRTYIQQREKR